MKKLTLNDYEIVKKYLDLAKYDGYNSNFVNMMLWDHEYNIFYYRTDDYMIMLHTYGNERFFSMPFCKKEHIAKAIRFMKDYANSHHFPFKIEVATEEFTQVIKNKFPDLLCIEDRNNFDYVYKKEALMNLKGKKMQKRRNHLNAFKKSNIDYIYKEIEDQDIDAVLKCLRKWDESKDNVESIQSEYIAIMYALIHRHELHLKTGCIYINGELEAFAIGSQLYHQTIEIHFEKANKDIRGLYVLIGQLFLQNNFDDALYVNREEDMGLLSLRKSKKDLHPDHMVKKYTIIEKDLHIRKATEADTQYIKNEWLNTFDDEDIYSTNFYFSHIYDWNNTYILQNGCQVIGSMQIRPYLISYQDVKEQTYFILGVMINKAYRSNGCMKYMIDHLLKNDFKNKKIMLQAYHPEIYHHLGFQNTYLNVRYVVDEQLENQNNYPVSFVCDKNDQLSSLYQIHCKQFEGYYLRDEMYYQNYFIPRLEPLDRKLLFIEIEDKLESYLEYELLDETCVITEFIYSNEKYIISIINALLLKYKTVQFDLPKGVQLPYNGQTYCQMLTNYPVNVNGTLFINEFY